jgi:hypothetical protein
VRREESRSGWKFKRLLDSNTKQLIKEPVVTDLHTGKVKLSAYRARKAEEANYLHYMPYAEYLQTAHWKKISQKTRDRFGCRCAVCNSDQFIQVHHRTYERRGFEWPEDLIVLCGQCHEIYHHVLPKPNKGIEMAQEPVIPIEVRPVEDHPIFDVPNEEDDDDEIVIPVERPLLRHVEQLQKGTMFSKFLDVARRGVTDPAEIVVQVIKKLSEYKYQPAQTMLAIIEAHPEEAEMCAVEAVEHSQTPAETIRAEKEQRAIQYREAYRRNHGYRK